MSLDNLKNRAMVAFVGAVILVGVGVQPPSFAALGGGGGGGGGGATPAAPAASSPTPTPAPVQTQAPVLSIPASPVAPVAGTTGGQTATDQTPSQSNFVINAKPGQEVDASLDWSDTGGSNLQEELIQADIDNPFNSDEMAALAQYNALFGGGNNGLDTLSPDQFRIVYGFSARPSVVLYMLTETPQQKMADAAWGFWDACQQYQQWIGYSQDAADPVVTGYFSTAFDLMVRPYYGTGVTMPANLVPPAPPVLNYPMPSGMNVAAQTFYLRMQKYSSDYYDILNAGINLAKTATSNSTGMTDTAFQQNSSSGNGAGSSTGDSGSPSNGQAGGDPSLSTGVSGTLNSMFPQTPQEPLFPANTQEALFPTTTQEPLFPAKTDPGPLFPTTTSEPLFPSNTYGPLFPPVNYGPLFPSTPVTPASPAP